MNKEKFLKLVKNKNIPEDAYSLNGGLPDDRYCINEKPIGWEVYYTERGKKYRIKIFENKEEAFQDLYNRLIKMKKAME